MDDLAIGRLDAKPGDTLVVRYNRGPLMVDVANRIKANIESCVPAGVKVLVIDSNFTLSVVPRQEQPPGSPAAAA